MKLNLDTLPFGRSELEVDQDVPLRPDDPETERFGARGILSVDNTEARVLVHGEMTVAGPAVCDRCLRTFTLEYPAPVEITIVRTAAPAPEELEDDSLVLHQLRGQVDLGEPLRETAVLHLPLTSICREDCLGICPSCGADRNQQPCECTAEPTDPRWDGLPS
ncbi:DUF177 domain-containing protein [bacterium]|nr:DUF177 domain-containing protein [bacterium]